MSVYYAIETGTGRVKIGYSADPEKRMQRLGAKYGSPFTLTATEPGTRHTEHIRHVQFADDWLESEFFVCSTRLSDHMIALREGRPGVPLPHPEPPPTMPENPVGADSPFYDVADRVIHGGVKAYLQRRHAEKMSDVAISIHLMAEYEIDVTDEAVRQWRQAQGVS